MLKALVQRIEHGLLRGTARCVVTDLLFFAIPRRGAELHTVMPMPQLCEEETFSCVAEDIRKRCSHVLFSVACPRYFQQFHQALVASTLRASPATMVHLHVIGASVEQKRIWQDALRQSFAGAPVMLSFDDTQPPSEEAIRAAWYQNARYLLAADVLAMHECPIFVTDIDIAVVRDLQEALGTLEAADVVLTRRSSPCPSKKFLAGFSLVANTVAARSFLREYVRLFRENAARLYFPKVDQRLLWMTMKRYREKVGWFDFSKVIATDRSAITNEHFLLCPKGKDKWAASWQGMPRGTLKK